MTAGGVSVTTVALEQVASVAGQPRENLELVLHRSRAAFDRGADIVVLPELAISGYVVDRELVNQVAEPIDGHSVTALSEVAETNDGLIVVGLCERAGDDVFNSVVVLGRHGVILHYRKLHLFGDEKDVYTPGDLGLPVVHTRFGTIGVCICYDLRFVEVMRVLALQGADLVIAPAAWVAGFDRAVPASGRTGHAESLLVQANLNQVAAVAVSQVAVNPQEGPATVGGSLACDAYGQILAGPLSRGSADSGMARVDVQAVRAARERGPKIRPREDRRTDVYSVNYAKTRL